jgi:hypothetical protein
VKTVTESQGAIRAAIEKVQKGGLPTSPYQPEVDGIAEQAGQAQEVLTPDPIGANATLAKAQGRAVALNDRVGKILQHFDEAREVSAALATLGEQVAAQRKEGLRLDEEGGDPDHPLAQTFETLEDTRKALREGDPESAGERLTTARQRLEAAQQTLAGVLKARDFCGKEQSQRVRETQRLREALGQYEAFESELKSEFAPSSWQNVAGNLTQARGLLGTFDRKAEEAAAAASSQSQKYLLGARLLSQVSQEQQAVFRLMSGVGEQLAALKALREESQRMTRELEDQQSGANVVFRQNDPVIGTIARNSLAKAEESKRQLAGLLNERQPNWLRIRQLVARALDEYATARQQAETDVQLSQQVSSEFDRVSQDARRVRSFLAGHEEDRLAANQHYQNAEETLNRVQSESPRAGGEWARLLELINGAAADLAHSESLAQEDIRLARQAETEIAEAMRTMRKARTYFSMGVTLNTADAEDQVAQADQLYRSQNYEQAIRTAAGAIQQIRQAQAVAVQQSYWRQMQMDSSRGRYQSSPGLGQGFGLGEAAAAAVAAAAGAMMERSAPPQAQSFSAPPLPEEGAAEEPEPSAASGSWASESTERGW